MSRITKCFEQLRQQGRKALIPFVTAGDPGTEITVPLMHTLVASGADILELGVPFSDPMADGPVIQQASERALKNNIKLTTVIDMVRQFRQRDSNTPVVLMGYLNPIEVMGYSDFAQAATDAGVDGVLTVDLPPEEAESLISELQSRGLDPIFLIAPTSSTQRIKIIAQAASGFIYYVSLRGVTGAGLSNTAEVGKQLQVIRRHTSLPLAVGFGIDSAEKARDMAKMADAVIIGSALVKLIAAGPTDQASVQVIAGDFMSPIRTAIDSVGEATMD